MSWRAFILFIALLPTLAGCASNRPLLSSDGPIFGRGGMGGAIGMRRAMPESSVMSEPVDVAVREDMGEPQVHVGVHESWGEPDVIPVALSGPKAVADTDGPYLLDSGDRLRIFVYGQPNLSRTYIVDHAGQIPIPLIGTVYARGMTTSGLARSIADRLGAEYVRDPQVTVDILQNRPFFILGEVRNAGQYPYVSGMTVETAVAIAGGYTERASQRSFRITRRIDGYVEQIDAPSDYVVKAGDTVFVYERFF
jgi:polysaccharide export outer membrane protein